MKDFEITLPGAEASGYMQSVPSGLRKTIVNAGTDR
jgi:hypothetical protein